MSNYAEVDPIIEKWVETIGATLFTEWAGERARTFYTPGDPPFEVFQIWVFPPQNGQISVGAGAVDTNDDPENELEKSWAGPTADLDNMLALAVRQIESWKCRARKKPDPQSPW